MFSQLSSEMLKHGLCPCLPEAKWAKNRTVRGEKYLEEGQRAPSVSSAGENCSSASAGGRWGGMKGTTTVLSVQTGAE